MSTPARVADRQPPLLSRLLDTPNLPEVVRSLEPRTLHALINTCGLEDCGAIVALATPEQLMRVFDLDLWRSRAPGQQDQFDADRFALWVAVLVDVGVDVAVEKFVKLGGLDADFVALSLSRHLLVLDLTCATPRRQSWVFRDNHGDDGEAAPSPFAEELEDARTAEIGGYTIAAKDHTSWDALLAVLVSLDAEHHDVFAALMSRCSRIATEEIDDQGGLYDVASAAEQAMSDVAGDREQRRERQGFVTPPLAVAFLDAARRLRLEDTSVPRRDHVTSAYFRDLAFEPAPPLAAEPSTTVERDAQARILEALRETGIVADIPAGLLADGNDARPERFPILQLQMSVVRERDDMTYAQRNQEIGYLANVLISGCSFDGCEFSGARAYEAALAVTNLGLENWPRQWLTASMLSSKRTTGELPAALPDDFLVNHNLVAGFQVGWTVLHEQVGLHVLRRLSEVLPGLHCEGEHVQDEIDELCRSLRQHLAAGTPWRDRLEAIALVDPLAWATLVGLVEQCPVVPRTLEQAKAPRRVLRTLSDFAFISENRQIAWARRFLESLPDRLAR
jgi:Family of unknown function (DUF6178)